MYVVDRHSNKKTQNIITKVKIKQHGIRKKRILEKSWMKYILLPFILSGGLQLIV